MNKYTIVLLTTVCLLLASNTNAQYPTFSWAKAIGGSSADVCNSVAFDASGNVYTTGSFEGTVDFDPGADTFNLTSVGYSDIYISKLDTAGNLVWAIAIGGKDYDNGFAITFDDSGNVYTTGTFRDTVDFDPDTGTFILITPPGLNASSSSTNRTFIAKYDSAGKFVWVKVLGGGGAKFDDNYTRSIALDATGNVYTAGIFQGTNDFDPGAGTYKFTSTGFLDIFISKLDNTGKFIWAKQLGGKKSEESYSLGIDPSGNVYTTGSFEDTADFNPGAGVFNLIPGGKDDIFISKLDSAGKFVWAKRMGEAGYDVGSSIAFDAFGNVYTTGIFNGTVDFDPGVDTFNLTSGGHAAIFISKLDATGKFVWAKAMSGMGSGAGGSSIALDASGNVYTTGSFYWAIDFDPGPGKYNLSSTFGSSDAFISKLDATGSFVWAKRLGGANQDGGGYIALDDSGNVYTVGSFEGTADFDPDPVWTYNLTSVGKKDIFVHKMVDCLSPAIPGAISGNATVCEGSTNTYYIKAVSGATSYTWTLPNGWSGSSTTDSITVTASSESGTISVTPQNSCGSSTAQLLTVTVDSIPHTGFNFTACESYMFKGNKITTSGVYYDSLTSAQGCDSIVILNLTINKSTSSSFTHTACNSFTFNGNTYTASGVYIDTIPNASSCDSIITLNLTINNNTGSSFSQTACNSYTFKGNSITSSGVYYDSLTSAQGCDSIVELSLTINKTTSSSIYVDACKEHLFNGATYTTSGMYVDTIPNLTSCDSIITLNLTIYNVNVGVTQNNTILTASQASANYQWLDCKTGYSPISGATNKSYTATANGDYAVAINQNGCSDTSACITVSSIGISDIGFVMSELRLYPNPNNGEFTIRSSSSGVYSIVNELGQVMQTIQLNDANNYTVNIGNLSAGVYFIVGYNNNELTRQKVVVLK